MNTSLVAIILALVISAISRVVTLPNTSMTLHRRNSDTIEEDAGSTLMQQVNFYSESNIFAMSVPTDGNNYRLGRPSAQLCCRQLTSPSPVVSTTCNPCWSKMLSVQLTLPGTCSFALTGDDGSLFTLQTEHTKNVVRFPKAGYLALMTCYAPSTKAVRDIDEATNFVCDSPGDAAIELSSGSDRYVLNIAANQTTFDIIGPSSRLGCIGPVNSDFDLCKACNFPVQKLDLSLNAGTCAFNFSGYADLVHHNAKDGPLVLSSSTQIWSVACGINDKASARREVSRLLRTRLATSNPPPLAR